jgi:hypothetical protein
MTETATTTAKKTTTAIRTIRLAGVWWAWA